MDMPFDFAGSTLPATRAVRGFAHIDALQTARACWRCDDPRIVRVNEMVRELIRAGRCAIKENLGSCPCFYHFSHTRLSSTTATPSTSLVLLAFMESFSFASRPSFLLPSSATLFCPLGAKSFSRRLCIFLYQAVASRPAAPANRR